MKIASWSYFTLVMQPGLHFYCSFASMWSSFAMANDDDGARPLANRAVIARPFWMGTNVSYD